MYPKKREFGLKQTVAHFAKEGDLSLVPRDRGGPLQAFPLSLRKRGRPEYGMTKEASPPWHGRLVADENANVAGT